MTDVAPIPPVPLGPVGQDLYDATAPMTYAEAETDYAWARYLAALGVLLDEIAALVRDDDAGNPGWTALASPLRCPLPWLRVLARWAGLRRPDRYTEAELRSLIGPHAPGLWRGTRARLLDGVQRYLTPDGALYFEERADGDAYKLRIFTYAYDTLNEAAIRSELEAAIPAGLLLDYQVRAGQTYALLRARRATYAAAKAAYATYDVMRTSVT
jgi:hypothetical protein